jgi:hypothetical protein
MVFFQPAANSRSISLDGDAVLRLNGGLLYAPTAVRTVRGNARVVQAWRIVNELHVAGNGKREDAPCAPSQLPGLPAWHDLAFTGRGPPANVAVLDMLLADAGLDDDFNEPGHAAGTPARHGRILEAAIVTRPRTVPR